MRARFCRSISASRRHCAVRRSCSCSSAPVNSYSHRVHHRVPASDGLPHRAHGLKCCNRVCSSSALSAPTLQLSRSPAIRTNPGSAAVATSRPPAACAALANRRRAPRTCRAARKESHSCSRAPMSTAPPAPATKINGCSPATTIDKTAPLSARCQTATPSGSSFPGATCTDHEGLSHTALDICSKAFPALRLAGNP